MNFLRGWYAIHDYENSRLGFVPQVGSSYEKAELVTNAPMRDMKSYDKELKGLRTVLEEWILITLIVLGGVAIIIGGGVLIVYICPWSG